ncbi:MAG: hypothetical protein Fur0025_35440 [Oscillatoriaceae cyanobacterium]
MEPLLAATVALGTVLGTKALEKTGEKLGETLFEKTKHFLTNLNQESPTAVTAIEKAPATPLNYSEIIPAIQSAAENRPELWAQIEELAELGRQEPRMIPHIETAINNLSQSNPSVVNNSKLAETIKNLFQGNTFNNTTFN